jgi:hypothetical protein
MEEKCPDGLSEPEWDELKSAYEEEYDNLRGQVRLRKTDKERLAYLSKWFAQPEKTGEFKDGDVFKHYVEKEYYVVTAVMPETLWYYVHRSTQYFVLETTPYQELRGKSVSMDLGNAQGLVGNKWLYTANIGASW